MTWSTTGRAALETWAPGVVSAYDAVAGLPAPDRSDPAVAAFADQFGVDVAGLDADQRAAFLGACGRRAFDVVQLVFAADFAPRVPAVLDRLFAASTWPTTSSDAAGSWPLLEELMVAVARSRHLDAPLTELVRLRGARQHDCAVCRSRRSRDAIEAGADDAMFAAVDHYADSDLPAPTRAALALTDAIIWTPYAVTDEVVAQVRADLSPAQAVEVVLDVLRNAANKIAVALGADAATVTDGVELFTTDADGHLTVV